MKYVCIHGHFYQPPRENPSLEAVELQDSAYPYHDWNERVTAECYAPNALARLLDDQQRIIELVNNYSRISFNFGPTLLLWMEHNAPAVLEAIRQGDRMSQERFSGHGSAIAQAYNHMILPLAHPRDQETQAIWGIRDFVARFGRQPEGMWLPETAANTASLEALAAQGIRFTILAPRQAKRVRRYGSRNWNDVSGDRIDPSRAYQVRLPSKKTIAVFFYDGPISQGVAFERLLDDGKRFADRLLSGFCDTRTWPQLSHIATDGESYGHHHRYGEMALSYALHQIESDQEAKLTNYGEFLELHRPGHYVEIFENSSWSCVHGVERWRSDCGCSSGGRPGWNQNWRAPLRESLDWLRDTLAEFFEAGLLKNPWAVRNDYIDVILDRSEENVEQFVNRHAAHQLQREEKFHLLKLLEMQRHAMLMYTSCGWFFDDLSGLETTQVLQYAGRAIYLALDLGAGEEVRTQFREKLRDAKSNLSEHQDGEQIYEKWVVPGVITPDRVAGHYAVSSLFESYGDKTKVYCYGVERGDYTVETEGRVRMAIGTACVKSDIIREEADLTFAVLHLGDHNITGGVRPFQGDEHYKELKDKLGLAFSQANTTEAIRLVDEQFGKNTFSLNSLFRDEQRRIVNLILKDTLATAGSSFRNLYENQAALMRFLTSLNIPVPATLVSAARIALNNQLQQALERPDIDAATVKSLVREAAMSHISLDLTTIEYAIRRRLEEQAKTFAKNPGDLGVLKRLHAMLTIAAELPTSVVLWEVQNLCFVPLVKPAANGTNGETSGAANGNGHEGDAAHQEWCKEAAAVRQQLRIQSSP